jgi:hypothetical protein
MSSDAANAANTAGTQEPSSDVGGHPSRHATRKGRPGAPELTPSDIARFWTKVAKSEGCWLWTACLTLNGGYGAFWADNRVLVASRVSIFLATGIWDASRHACHHCDTPACVRPEHLYYGTDAENARDSNMRGKRAYVDGKRKFSRRHLFSAAPAMLAALKEAREEITYWHADMLTPEERSHPRGSGWARVADRIDAAIAAAEGRS